MQKIGKKAEKLKVNLPHGAIKIVAEKAETSTDTVRNVLVGKSQNLSVMKALREYLNEFKEVKEGITNTAQQLSFATN